MNPKSFPRRLDSKTGCLRITVPENLDLALEGLIRKVLREQPKPDDLYAFAANYFEALLKIRDRAGVEYTTTRLCPFHNDEEAREMIVLAGTFSRLVPGGVPGKGPAPLKAETKKETDKAEPKKETDKAEPERGVKRSKETLKDSHSKGENKQATPDLIKKLPLLAQNQGLNGEEVAGQKTTDLGHELERTETIKQGGGEEEYLTSDPIKEFVEKELATERNSEEKVAEGEAPEPSEKGSPNPTARERQNEEAEGGAPLASSADERKGALGRDSPGTTDIVGGVIYANEDGEKWKIDPRIREIKENGVEAGEVVKHAEDKIGDAAQPEGEPPLEETQQKKEKEKEKENEEETSKLRAEEESENKTETEEVPKAELPPLPPSPGTEEKRPPEPVREVPPSCNAETGTSREVEDGKVPQGEASSEVASPQEKGIAESGGVQHPAEDESETDAQPSTPSVMKTDEESPETRSLVTNSYDSKLVENDDAEPDKRKEFPERKEATISARDLMMEAASTGTERGINSSETRSSPERAKGVQEVKEDGASFEKEGVHQTKGGEPNEGNEKQDTKADDPSKPNLNSTEEGTKLTSGGAVEAEHASGQSQTGAEDGVAEPGEEKGAELSGKLDPGQQTDGLKILVQEQFSHSRVTGPNREAEINSGDEEGKATGGDKKLSDVEVKAKDESPTERRESPGNQTYPEEKFLLHKAEDVQCTAEAPTVESTDTDDRRTLLTDISLTSEGSKSEEKGDAKQVTPRHRAGPTGDAGRPTEPGGTPEIATRETESAKPQEFKVEGAPAAETETASLADEELCSVVDINHLKKDGGNQEEPKLGKPRPENTAEEKSPEPEGSLSPGAPNGETWRENQNDKLSFQQKSEAEDATQGKVQYEEPPSATALQEPEKSETDEGKDNPAEEILPETWEGFDPSAEGKQIIIIEEPEKTNETPEEHSPPGEIQIKTIQTRYYDALRVPETVTREYRVHQLLAPTIDALLRPASPRVQESPTDDNAVPPTPKTSPTSEGGVSPYAEAVEAQTYIGPPYCPSNVGADALLVDGLDLDAQVSDSDDLPHLTTPTSDVASNLAELSLQAASETFLTKEKLFSSLEREEIRFVNPTQEGRVTQSSLELDEGGEETAGARPPPQTPGKEEGAERQGGPPALADGRAPNGDPPTASVPERPVSEPRPQAEEEDVLDAPRLRRTASGGETVDEESFHFKNQERNILRSCPEEVQVGSRSDGRRESLSTKRSPTGEASSAETDSATTEVKGADSARRDFASARGLSSARSLDLGKRNPLQRTRSLSTHRHGVADFEVWSTIEKELEEAATKIQSKFRGYKTRKKLRREVAVQISTEESSKRSTPVEADDADNRPRATGEFHDGIVLAEHPR